MEILIAPWGAATKFGRGDASATGARRGPEASRGEATGRRFVFELGYALSGAWARVKPPSFRPAIVESVENAGGNAMSTAEMIAERVEALPVEKQEEVLDFVEFLGSRPGDKKPLHDPGGLWADLGIDITEEDIAEARKEMWGNFPRDDI